MVLLEPNATPHLLPPQISCKEPIAEQCFVDSKTCLHSPVNIYWHRHDRNVLAPPPSAYKVG